MHATTAPRDAASLPARALGALVTATPAALYWAWRTHSPWVALLTYVVGASPYLWFPYRVSAPIRLGFAFLVGGTAAAIALLTGHAPPP